MWTVLKSLLSDHVDDSDGPMAETSHGCHQWVRLESGMISKTMYAERIIVVLREGTFKMTDVKPVMLH